MKGLDYRDTNTRKAEGGMDEMTSLDFYRTKENKIERHLDDAREICLAGLATMTQRSFAEKTKLSDRIHDRLDIKGYVKASGLPTLDDSESVDALKTDVNNWLDADHQNEKLFAQIGSEAHEKHILSWNTSLDIWFAFVAELRSKFAAGAGALDVTEDGIIMTKTSKGATVSRFNIKVSATDMPVRIVMDLASKFKQNAHILDAGFKMKTLQNKPNDRDGVIIYSTAEAFSHIAQVLRSTFRGDISYHDRHADPAIFGGINLKDADGTDFPAIRVCVEPRSIGVDFTTFNDMQSTVLSEALIAYIQTHYDSNKDMLLEDFYFDSEDANEHWKVEFPQFYNQAARKILGENTNLNNIAFFSHN